MKVRELIALLQKQHPEAEVVIVLDKLDVDPVSVCAGTTPENDPCCWIITSDVEGIEADPFAEEV